MFFKKSALILLPVLAVLAVPPCRAEDMPPLENYKPLPQLFDEKPVEPETVPFLTLLAPPPEQQANSKTPPPPHKPVKAKKLPPAKTKIKKASVRKIEPVRPPGKPSRTQLDDAHLANPNVRDVLASIEGVKPPKANPSGSVSLAFVSGESVLTLDMKNTLLRDYVPKVKNSGARIAIQAYAAPVKNDTERLFTARVLEIKDFLQAAGIDPTRIDVMPLGQRPDAGMADRVDIVTVGKKD